MKYYAAIFMLLFTFVAPLHAQNYGTGSTYVQPHYRSNGTYVPGYYRTTPNSSRYDNYSTRGNTNPYTGQSGTVSPYRTYQPNYSNYPSQPNYGCTYPSC